MTRYLIYGENARKPVRKTKHENEALLFCNDFKNLQQYGCLTVVREDDDGIRQTWDNDLKAWVASAEGSDG